MNTTRSRAAVPLLFGLFHILWCAGIAAGSVDHYEYDSAGNLTAHTDPRDRTTHYTYDPLNRLVSIRNPSDPAVSLDRDELGRIVSMADGAGTTRYQYDIHDRLVRTVDPNGNTLAYTYDLQSRMASMSYPDGSVTYFEWGKDDQTLVVRDGPAATTFTIDPLGQIAERILPNGVRSIYMRNKANQVVEIRHEGPTGRLLLKLTYTYDGNGNRTGEARTFAGAGEERRRYRYDALSRLVGYEDPKGAAVTYRYDPAGNRTAMISATDSVNYTYRDGQLIRHQGAGGWRAYRYDSRGNMIERQDASGSVLFSYDDANRLIEVTSGSTAVRFGYDGLGRRLWKEANGARTLYAQHGPFGEQVVFCRTTGSAVRLLPGSLCTGEARTVGPRYYLDDALGSVVGLVDANGSLTATAAYDPFGQPVGAPLGTIRSFTGEEMDPETGLIYLRARYYDPRIGRFLSRDPAPMGALGLPQTANSYAYALNNPAKLTDPNGQAALPILGAVMLTSGVVKGVTEASATYARLAGQPDACWHVLASGLRGFGIGTLTPLIKLQSWLLGSVASGAAGEFASQAIEMAQGYRSPWAFSLGTVGEGVIGNVAAAALNRGLGAALTPFLPSTDASVASVFKPALYRALTQADPDAVGRVLTTKAYADAFSESLEGYLSTEIGRSLTQGKIAAGVDAILGNTSSTVGGVSLETVVRAVGELNDIVGATIDPHSGQMVLIGAQNLALPSLNLDDLVVAIRAVYRGESPSISIEPCQPGADNGCLKVVYNNAFQLPNDNLGWLTYGRAGQLTTTPEPATYNTHFGQVLFSADRYLKTLSLGTDNLDGTSVHPAVPGFISELERLAAQAQDCGDCGASAGSGCLILTEADRSRPSACHRIWLLPDTLVVRASSDGQTVELEQPRIQAKARFVRFDASGRMIDVPGADPAVAAFVAHLNAHYAAFAAEQPALAELEQLAKIVGLVQWLKEKDVPIDLSWLEHYQVAAEPTPLTTPGIRISHQTVALYGGVEFSPNRYSGNSAQAEELAAAALRSRPSLAGSWEFTARGQRLRAVALTLSPKPIRGAYTTERSDLAVPVCNDLKIALTATYSSVAPFPGAMGYGWEIDLPRLTFATRSAGPGLLRTEAIIEMAGRQQVLSLTTDGVFSPMSVGSPVKYLAPVQGDPLTPRRLPGMALELISSAMPPRILAPSGQEVEIDGWVLQTRRGLLLAFDPKGRLTVARDPHGHILTHSYQDGLLSDITDRAGSAIHLEYDTNHRLTQAIGSNGEIVRYRYDASGCLAEVRNEGTGIAVTYGYDQTHRLACITNGVGVVAQENLYDDFGRLLETCPGGGKPLHLSYDDPSGSTTCLAADGQPWVWQYDAEDRLQSITGPDGALASLTYEGDRLTGYTDFRGGSTRMAYDQSGFLQEIVDPLGRRTQLLAHDQDGNPQILVEPGDRMTYVEYANGVPARVTSGLRYLGMGADGAISYTEESPLSVTLESDKAGILQTIRDPAGAATRLSYGPGGELTQIELPGSRRWTFLRDVAGWPMGFTDPAGNRTEISCDDPLGRVTALTLATGRIDLSYADSPTSHQVIIKDAEGNTSQYDYSGAQLTKVSDPAGNHAFYAYDREGRLSEVTDPNGNSLSLQYDAHGQLVELRRRERPTAVLTTESVELPASLPTLHQNYPNPLNGQTMIGFTLPAASQAELSVYAVTGQRVALLLKAELAAGQHEVRWNGRDDQNIEVASGTYLYRLQAGAFSATRKLLILR